MKTTPWIVVCVGLAAAIAHAAETAAPPALEGTPTPPPKIGGAATTSHPALIGTWHFTWVETGYEADFTFAADGTFTTQNGGPDGTWRVEKSKVLLEAPNTAQKIMSLPINPSGTKVFDARKSRNVKAVKQKS